MRQCESCGDEYSPTVVHQQWHCIASLKRQRDTAIADAARERERADRLASVLAGQICGCGRADCPRTFAALDHAGKADT